MDTARTNSLTVRTPEGVAFTMTLASPFLRFLAFGVDLGVLMLGSYALSLVALAFSIISPDLAASMFILLYFVASIGYGIALEWLWRGQTLGKRVVGLRVADEEGLRLRFSQIVLRNLLRAIDSLPVFYLVGGLASLFSRRAQRLGDAVAGTVVVWNRPGPGVDLSQIQLVKYNSFRGYPHIEARLRNRVTPEEIELAVQALFRREELDAGARVELFGDLAAYFRAKATFPEEAVFGLTDEQYVRNVVDSVFRTDGARRADAEHEPGNASQGEDPSAADGRPAASAAKE